MIQYTEQRELAIKRSFSEVLSTGSTHRCLSCVTTASLRPAQHPCSCQHLRIPVTTQTLTGREAAAGTVAAALKQSLLQALWWLFLALSTMWPKPLCATLPANARDCFLPGCTAPSLGLCLQNCSDHFSKTRYFICTLISRKDDSFHDGSKPHLQMHYLHKMASSPVISAGWENSSRQPENKVWQPC